MVHICKLDVSGELTTLMETFGFFQVTGSSPDIHWNNPRSGIGVSHHQNLPPRDVNEVIKLVYDCGMSNGSYQQIEAIKDSLHSAVDTLVHNSNIRAGN